MALKANQRNEYLACFCGFICNCLYKFRYVDENFLFIEILLPASNSIYCISSLWLKIFKLHKSHQFWGISLFRDMESIWGLKSWIYIYNSSSFLRFYKVCNLDWVEIKFLLLNEISFNKIWFVFIQGIGAFSFNPVLLHVTVKLPFSPFQEFHGSWFCMLTPVLKLNIQLIVLYVQ